MTPSPSRGGEFVPAAVVDPDDPVPSLDLGATPPGVPYGSPLATVELPLRDARVGSTELAAQVWKRTRSAIEEHVRAHRCLASEVLGGDAVLRGLRSDACSRRALSVKSAPFVTVVVPTAGRLDPIRPYIEKLTAMTYPRFEVVVDNRPGDPSTHRVVEELGRRDARVRYVAEPWPGSLMARNRGLREAASEIGAFTDDDIEVDTQWLLWMVEPFVADKRVDVVTGLVMPGQLNTPQHRWFEQSSGYGNGLLPRRFDTGPCRPDNRLLFAYRGAPFGSGASMAFRRAALLAIGGFDPALGVGSPAIAAEDIEALSRVLVDGGRLAHQPRALCRHHHYATDAALRRQASACAAGATAIFAKWLLRDPRLARQSLHEGMDLVHGWLLRRRHPIENAVEVSRLDSQMRVSEERRLLRHQLVGYALGQVFYLRSVAWARRRHLRDALPARTA